MTYDIVIIGNSAAGLSAVKKIRSISNTIKVAIIDREDRPAYSRVMTPYYSGGKIEKEGLFIVDLSFYQGLNIDTFFGFSVVQINTDQQSISLDNDETVQYQQLLIATGAEATQINVSSPSSSVLRHMSDAEHLANLFESVGSVTAIGAGLVSLPVLSHLPETVEKNLIIGSNRIFSRVVNAEAAVILEEKLTAKGLNIYKNDDIQSYTENGCLSLSLKSGLQIDTDVLVVGKGVQPNIKLAKSAGLAVNDGVLIDDQCMTSCEGVYAAGDVAEGKDFISGDKTIQGNWMTAVEQGEIAAINMLGQVCSYEGSLKNNITEIFGIDVAVIGYYWDDAPNSAVYHELSTGVYRKVFLDDDDRVIGVTMIGNTNDSGLFYHMIKSRSAFPGQQILNKTNTYAMTFNRVV